MSSTMVSAYAVSVFASDPLSRAGVASQIGEHPSMRLANGDTPADVAVVVTDVVDDGAVQAIRAASRDAGTRVVAVVGHADDAGVLAAVEAGASGLLRRRDADAERLASAVHAAAAGDGTLPPDLLGRLMRQVGQLQRDVLAPQGLNLSGLTEREVKVLRLVADGLSTAEVARSLAYSERTIKNIIQDVVSRFRLRNRAHAVAFALREGLI
jgi:DNA-binding NarL/FixJ family response regulator